MISLILGMVILLHWKLPDILVALTTEYPTAIIIEQEHILPCFTPHEKCLPKLQAVLQEARNTLYVRAYALTSQVIAQELIKAKKRGVSVQILCDKDQAQQPYSKLFELINSGIEVNFEKTKAYAHNQVIIVDKAVLVTGSYNFTHSA